MEIRLQGLTLKLNPFQMVKEEINQNSQKIIDCIIEEKYLNCIREFKAWKKQEYLKAENEGVDYKNEVHVDVIQDLADMVRHVLPLHSDSECIYLSPEYREIIEDAQQFWKYNEFYGFKLKR